jgi:nucleobase:cation symporter-1, NCS1 family
VAEHALAGRLPILRSGRIYAGFGSYMLTFTAIAAGSYSYLVGTALTGVGSTRLGLVGYLIGLVLGMSFVPLAGGALSYRYGVDTVDAGKPTLGMRGSLVLLVGVLVCTLGWANVLLAMTARGVVRVINAGQGKLPAGAETEVVMVGLALVVVLWLLVRRGPAGMERVATFCAGTQLIVALVLLAAVLYRFGIAKVLITDVPEEQAYSHDRITQLTYAVEFGVCNSLGMLPYMGGLSRLVRSARHLVSPAVLGYAFFGAFVIAAVGAFATAGTGQVDPGDWIPLVAGIRGGTLLFAAMLIANLGALVTQVYLAGISVQQIRALARLPWSIVVAVVLIPSVFVTFGTRWVLDHVMNWLAYNGVLFVGLSAVLFVDFFILRRERVVPAQLFATRPGQHYWFWGGVNWIAVAVIAGATAMYLRLFDPLTLRAGGWFRYAGAAVPTVVMSSCAYYLLMKALVIPRGMGNYVKGDAVQGPGVQVGL